MKYKDTINIALAHNLRAKRNSLKLTQEQFAEKAGISSITISKIETQDQWPSPETLQKIANILNIQPYQLFINEDDILLPNDNLVILSQQLKTISQSFDNAIEKKKEKNKTKTLYKIKHTSKN